MQQVGQLNKLIATSNLVYCMLLNPALATQQSASSRVSSLCSLQKNSPLHGPGLSWWNLVTRGNTASRNQISAFNHLLHEDIPSPPGISSSLMPCTPSSFSHTQAKGNLHHHATWPRSSGAPPERYLSTLSTQKDGGPWRKQLIITELQRHLNVSAPKFKLGLLPHPYCYHFSTFPVYLLASTINVLMQHLKEIQAKSMETSVWGGRDLGWYSHHRLRSTSTEEN